MAFYLLVGGCSSEQPTTAVSESVAKETKTLTIYSGRSESLVGPVIEEFSKSTGIDVQVKYGKSAAMAALLIEEGSNSPADLYFAQEPGTLGAVASMLSTLPESIQSQVPNWARSPEGKWVGISGRARTIAYSTERVNPDDLPVDIWDLVDPKWKGRIGWAPTNASFQVMVTAMRQMWGEEKTGEWLLGIQANDAKIYPKNTPQIQAIADGEIDVGLVNHYYLHRFLAEKGDKFPVRNHHVSGGGPGSLVMVAGAGILSTSDDTATAQKFLEFMLSEIGQAYFASQTFEYPLKDGVKSGILLVPMDQLNRPDIDVGGLSDIAGTQALLSAKGVLP